MNITEITITKTTAKGSNAIRWNVDRDGVPFGQIWTFKAKGETHLFHVKTLANNYDVFATYAEAEFFIRGEM